MNMKNKLPADRKFMKWESDGDKGWVDVPCAALDEVIRRCETAVDRDALLMSFEELTLVLKPERGLKGWEQYKEIMVKSTANKWPLSSTLTGAVAQFSVVLELAFEPYQVEKDAKMMALQSSAYFGGISPFAQQQQLQQQQQIQNFNIPAHLMNSTNGGSSSSASASSSSSSSIQSMNDMVAKLAALNYK